MHLLEEGGHSGNSCYSPVLVHAGTRHVARELLWRSPGFDTHTPCRLTKHINNDSFGERLCVTVHRSPRASHFRFDRNYVRNLRHFLHSKILLPSFPSRNRSNYSFPISRFGNESEGKLEGRKEGGLVENNWGKKRLTEYIASTRYPSIVCHLLCAKLASERKRVFDVNIQRFDRVSRGSR